MVVEQGKLAFHMTAGLYNSPTLSWKTQFAIQRVRFVLSENPMTRVWVVVSDRLQASSFQRQLAEAGGLLVAQINKFGDIYRHILEEAMKPLPVVSESITLLLIQSIID